MRYMEKNTPSDFEVGRIIDIDSSKYTATVFLVNIGNVLEDVAWETPYGASIRGAGFIYQPTINSYCNLRMRYGGTFLARPIIASFSPQIGEGDVFNPPYLLDVDEGGDNSNANLKGVNNKSGRSGELLPGDQLLTGDNGETVGILDGGLALLRVSELCQILAFQQDDLLRTVARNQQNYSDMGEKEIKNTKGEIFSHEFSSNTEKESRGEKYRMRLYKMKGSGEKKGSSGASDPADTENLLFLQLNQIVNPDEPSSEVPVAEVCFDVNGGLQVRSATEIKSEIIKSTVDGFAALVNGVVGEPGETSSHGGAEAKDQDLYDHKGAEVHSVIHQTAKGEIHIQDNNRSSIDLQSGHISIKCDKTFHVKCSEFKVDSETTNWTNTKTVVWAQGTDTTFQGKNMLHDFTSDTRKASSITDEGGTVAATGAISHN